MFEQLNALPADPILGVIQQFQQDTNPNKVDLGVGVYRDDQGRTPVMHAVKRAEVALVSEQTTKAYVGPMGNLAFNAAMAELLFGADSAVLKDERLALLQTPGGCGALRVAAELIRATSPNASLWVSDPTWGNHIPLLGGAGVPIKTYPYYCHKTHRVDFLKMMESLSAVKAGDLVLLHGCCHNPSGADLTQEQWQAIARCAEEQGFTPFIDIAYQGFGDGLEDDAYGLRVLAETLPEVLVAASCSKNFGVYKERVGAVGLVASNRKTAQAASTHFQTIVRGIYSMPPDHGAAVVAKVLTTPDLYQEWAQELQVMRERVIDLRRLFSSQMRALTESSQFDFVAQQKGMFSFLGVSGNQVKAMAESFGIYMLDSSRASIAGLRRSSINYVCASLAEVCQKKDG